VKALTLTQPWATLVATGAKRIETRSWPTGFRGPLAIHAAKGFPPSARALCIEQPFAAALRRAGYHGLGLLAPAKVLPLGAIIAAVELVDVVRIGDSLPVDVFSRFMVAPDEGAFGDYTPGRYAWLLNPIGDPLVRTQPLPEPIPCRGALGLWNVPDDLLPLIDRKPEAVTSEAASPLKEKASSDA
jgi:hypothetical protein